MIIIPSLLHVYYFFRLGPWLGNLSHLVPLVYPHHTHRPIVRHPTADSKDEKKSSVARCLVLSLLYQLEGVFACHGHRQVAWGRGSTRGMWPATAQLLRNSGAGQVGKTVINSLLLGSGGTLTTFACVYGEGVWEKKIK